MQEKETMHTNSRVDGPRQTKILQIGNYPPPACGWAVQTKLLVEAIRRRGIVCQVMNINENRKLESSEYIDVRNGFDYIRKLMCFARDGYRFQIHVNGQSKTGYVLAILAAVVGRLSGYPVTLSWRGGLRQNYFPRTDDRFVGAAYRLLFQLSGEIICNNMQVKQAIERYGIEPERVVAIPGFSRQHLEFQQLPLSHEAESFLNTHHPVFFCYVSFRPEYRLPILREVMRKFRQVAPRAGFIWLGFPAKEFPDVQEFVADWPPPERESLLLLGNLTHDEFLTLLSRCFAYIRTPACDGVSSSVLESLALGIPVIASENHSRPPSAITYREDDAADLCEKLSYVTDHYEQVKGQTHLQGVEDNIERTVDWLLGESAQKAQDPNRSLVHAD
jgi:glycosyltransferase involved in cell wall biosynthesis